MANPTHDMNELKRRMQGAIQLLKQELGGLRTGRASPSLLEPVQVEAYGTHMPLNQVATVSVPEPRLLSVQVWDKSMVHAVEKAIQASNLGLNPSTDGQVRCLKNAYDLAGISPATIELISSIAATAAVVSPWIASTRRAMSSVAFAVS